MMGQLRVVGGGGGGGGVEGLINERHTAGTVHDMAEKAMVAINMMTKLLRSASTKGELEQRERTRPKASSCHSRQPLGAQRWG